MRGTRFNPDKGCLQETRLKFLNAIADWVHDPSSPRALLLVGAAGTGKSSIAHETAKRFHSVGSLTTSYFFTRMTSHEPYKFFTTLARHLCVRYPAFKAALSVIIRNKPDLVAATDYTTLFESLIVEPFKDLQVPGPVLIVIDALDESEDANRRGPGTFHGFLGRHIHQSPSCFRILMTTRPEPNIMDAFPSSPYLRHMFMDDPNLADAVDHDINTYMQMELSGTGLGDEVLRQLVLKAGGLFVWATVVCNYIAYPPPGLDPQYCVEMVLHPTDENGSTLDALYMTILERFDMEDPHVSNTFRSVMGQVLGVFEPLSVTALNIMRQCSPDVSEGADVSTIVERMGSLLSNTSPASEFPLLPFHISFIDFLTNPKRSGKFYINLDAAHSQLASAAVQTMNKILRFNMCDLETSYCLNSEVPDLDERIAKHIHPALVYSCRYWGKHLAYASKSEALFNSLETFMKEKLLFWLEVLSVKQEVSSASTALLMLREWLGRIRDQLEVSVSVTSFP